MTTGIIVLEGADAAGKTTLADALRSRLGARYLHSRPRRNGLLRDIAILDLAARWSTESIVVIDRFWITELVYGLIYRGAPAYDQKTAVRFHRALTALHALTVLCVPYSRGLQIDRHKQRWSEGAEGFSDVTMVIDIFRELRRTYSPRRDMFIYDMDKDGHYLDVVCGRIVSALRVLQHRKVFE